MPSMFTVFLDQQSLGHAPGLRPSRWRCQPMLRSSLESAILRWLLRSNSTVVTCAGSTPWCSTDGRPNALSSRSSPSTDCAELTAEIARHFGGPRDRLPCSRWPRRARNATWGCAHHLYQMLGEATTEEGTGWDPWSVGRMDPTAACVWHRFWRVGSLHLSAVGWTSIAWDHRGPHWRGDWVRAGRAVHGHGRALPAHRACSTPVHSAFSQTSAQHRSATAVFAAPTCTPWHSEQQGKGGDAAQGPKSFSWAASVADDLSQDPMGVCALLWRCPHYSMASGRPEQAMPFGGPPVLRQTPWRWPPLATSGLGWAAWCPISGALNSMDTAVSPWYGDLWHTSPAWKRIEQCYEHGLVALTMVGSPCETFSEARFTRPPPGDTSRWPRPLRSAADFFGLPEISWTSTSSRRH